MAMVLGAQDLSKTYASHTLFTGVALQVVEDDRLGLIGPNGAGKSTLLKILSGLEAPDAGEVTRRRGLRQVYVPQDDRFAEGATPLSAVCAAMRHDGGDDRVAADTRAAIILSKLGFTEHGGPVATLSGGWRKRLSLACALVDEPEVLMLDEPTNHLDLEGILWLERFVQRARMAIVFVTHDRRFLENAARRIIELSPAYPGGILEVAGNYTEFVRRKNEFLDGQMTARSALANQVARDTAWLLQGVQARRTRNKTQLAATIERRAELKTVTTRTEAPNRTASIDFQATGRKTKKLLALHRVAKSMEGKPLFASLDLILAPGRRIGLLGPNGSGKSTLLRVIAGDLEPDAGTIKRADNLRVVAFSQQRGELVPTMMLQEALCRVGDTVDYRGRSIHVSAWAARFLFASTQLSTYVGSLSGGEQARVLIANLMLEPADVLLLDEPTNDLDIPSLEVLEQALLEFPGAILLVTHDRFMIERICTEFLALDGRGGCTAHASYEQWEAEIARQAAAEAAPARRKDPSTPRPPSTSRRLSFKQQRDLDGMEATILAAEAEVTALEARSNDPAVLADRVRLTETYRQLSEAQQRVAGLYQRWVELDAMRKG